MTHLNENEREWIACYGMGDTLLFKSNLGNIDTLIITFSALYDKSSPIYIGDEYHAVYEAHGAYYFTIHQNFKTNGPLNGMVSIQKCYFQDLDNERLCILSNFGRRFSLELNVDSTTLMDTIFDNVNFELYDNIKFNNSNSKIYENQEIYNLHIDEYIINKHYGLIYYRYDDGEEFVRKFE